MLPRLCEFSTDINDYTTSGFIGFFTKIISNEVKQVLNGEFTLELEVMIDDPMTIYADLGKTIMANACIGVEPQIFIITCINYQNETVKIYAEHIKELFFRNLVLASNDMQPYTYSGTPAGVINDILENEVELPNYFTFSSDIETSVSMDVGSKEKTLEEILLDPSEGIAKQCGGEFLFSNFYINLRHFVGNPSPRFSAVYGRNMKSFELNQSIENSYTHLLPYADVGTKSTYTGDISKVRIYTNDRLKPLSVVSSPYTNILKQDFSYLFTKKGGYVDPTDPHAASQYEEVEAVVNTRARDFVSYNHSLAYRQESIRTEVEPSIRDFEHATIGDKCWVINDKIPYREVHRITEIRYDCVKEKIKSIVISNEKAPYTLYDFITGITSKRKNVL